MQQYLPKVVEGFFLTVQLALVVVVTGIACGFALALVRALRFRVLNFCIVVFADALRALPPLTNRTIAITKGTALGAVVAVGEILYQAQSAYSFSYNPSPLVLGAVAYLILFLPVVWFGRWVETRFAWRR